MAGRRAVSGDRFVMISGCSGGGKSTLIEELARRGHAVVREPGRRIIADVRAGKSGALPWDDPAGFAVCAVAMAVADYEKARGLTFFDRGVVDAVVALEATTDESGAALVARYRYDKLFLAPPWPDIYETDHDRRHSLEKALSDYGRVEAAYRAASYDAVMLPRDSVAARADFTLANLT
ncbi:MAG: ATPase [Sphingomonas sp.]|uniref:AAA family ATPase n=1 Tax=Sphingomonas sp. TaxID=28214 RepID=UPI00122B1330|nr:AAA family ATPase [Sphingomonas sp.]THD38331.1 MAG: ATPase [Sphingomonas sp.]